MGKHLKGAYDSLFAEALKRMNDEFTSHQFKDECVKLGVPIIIFSNTGHAFNFLKKNAIHGNYFRAKTWTKKNVSTQTVIQTTPPPTTQSPIKNLVSLSKVIEMMPDDKLIEHLSNKGYIIFKP